MRSLVYIAALVFGCVIPVPVMALRIYDSVDNDDDSTRCRVRVLTKTVPMNLI